MKIHPAPINCNIALRYDVTSVLTQADGCRRKKLRRLPHIFAKVLLLPFHSDADVSIVETPESLIFTAITNEISPDVSADAIEIHPGVTKIVVRGTGVFDLSGTELELDLWRFRLPDLVRPELASAVFVDGELVVTVPKGEQEGAGDVVEGMGGGNLVLVQ